MNRNQKSVYCFLYDESKKFYRAKQQPDGSWTISSNSQMYPLRHNPKNLLDSPVEFGTNRQYFSMNRSINYPLEFTFDGAAILNYKYCMGKGVNEIMFFSMFQFESATGKYTLCYSGRIDFQQKTRDEKIATFTVPVIDDSAWGILSQNDDVEYAIDCSENNPKVVKVLFDNFTLFNRYTFQTVQAPIVKLGAENTFVIPFPLVLQDGDSAGIVAKGQTGDSTDNEFVFGAPDPDDYTQTALSHFFYTFFPLNAVNIAGTFTFTWSTKQLPSGGLWIFFRTSTGQSRIIFTNQNVSGVPPGDLVGVPPVQVAYGLNPGQTYIVDFNFNIDLVPGEKIWFFARLDDNAAREFSITPITTNIFVNTLTKAESAVAFGLRPLDLLREIVSKATLERYTMDSLFFLVNNKTIIIPGDSIRGIKDAKIYTSFRDFFQSFDSLFFMALRNINGSIFMEQADEVYKKDTNIIDLGELIECTTRPATEYYGNELFIGSPKQDYRHASGRLEFNNIFQFSLPFTDIKSKISKESKYRFDCYGIIFLLLDYRGGSTVDNSGDKQVFVVDVTDEQGSALDNVETFENINVNNAPLQPIIKYPLTGDIINNDKPLLRGIGIPGNTVNIYINGALDGGTVVDINGNWEYQILTSLPSYDPGVNDGLNVIEATFTDLSGALDTINLIIDTTVVAPTGISYPTVNDSLYNNLPLVKGVAPPLTNIDIFLDGIFVAAVVATNSCKWEYKFVTPIPNGSHILSIAGSSVPFTVDSFTAFPLITYIGSELDGFPIVNNLPLIRGVGKPGTSVSVWLNYVSYSKLGTATVDANGDWIFQVVPITYSDPVSGLPVVLAPIRNGLSIVSTGLINNVVGVNVTGYKLNRPPYDSITGVLDNTVFNTRLSPKRSLLRHGSMFASIMNKQKNDFIHFEKADKNSNLRTVLGSEVVEERADVPYSSLGNPIAVLEYANIKAVARKTFAQILYDFNNGGTIKATFKGNEIFMLPIGSMRMKNIMDDVQEWSLLISPQTPYSTLLNLYRTGLTLNIMQNAIFHSDYNALHFVAYNMPDVPQYEFKELYDDWFCNRNSAWLYNPEYTQKYQTTEVITDQVITNGIATLSLRMYRCKDAALIDSIDYNPANPAPIPPPEIVMEAKVDLNDYPEDTYFFVLVCAGLMVAISERIEVKHKHKRTILVESSHSTNMPGVFFSTGFKTIIRVEGLVKKLQPVLNTVIANEESGDSKLLWGNVSRHRIIRYGTARGLPDYLAMKIANALANDACAVEGVYYTLDAEETLNPSEDIDGIPLYYYNVNMKMQENQRGKVFAGQPDAELGGVILVVDASAIGLPTDVLIDIKEE